MRLAADDDLAWLVARLWLRRGHVFNRLRRAAFHAFCRAFAVGVFGFDGDDFAFVSRCQGVGRPGADFLPVRVPAVGHRSQPVFVGKGVGGAQGFAHFGFTADGDVAGRRMVARDHRCFAHRIRRVAGYVFLVARLVGVVRFDGDGFAFVGRRHGVGFARADFLAASQPAVGDAAVRDAVGVGDGRGQGFAYLRLAADDHAAGLILSGVGVGIR